METENRFALENFQEITSISLVNDDVKDQIKETTPRKVTPEKVLENPSESPESQNVVKWKRGAESLTTDTGSKTKDKKGKKKK